ncbi:MAG: GNAT family N-acetyltransferase [Vicinamibacteria bacterium]|nr:GNAT family N-acetyltransferase [Vicinamibacteria bacterium]
MRIREAISHQDLDEVTRIQREVWNVEDIDIAGRIQLRASQHAGGSVLVAEAGDGTLAGFAYAFPALEHGEAFWHSDMLAVRPAFRGGKVGQALKWAQRADALKKGVRRITWTFDPMQAGNAHLNLELLGASAGEYLSNFYGVTSSDLHHGLPTDRLLASWDLDSLRVAALSRGEKPGPIEAEATVSIPSAWNEVVRRDPERARAEQARVERELTAAFASGLVIAGFDKARTSYVLARKRP